MFKYLNLHFIHIGEANAGNPTYACKFARMIVRWREIWNNRTNGITDIQFPFGFVQVSFTTAPKEFHISLGTRLNLIPIFIVINEHT